MNDKLKIGQHFIICLCVYIFFLVLNAELLTFRNALIVVMY